MPAPITLAYQRQLAVLRSTTSTAAERVWLGLGSYDEADVARFLAQVLPHVGAGQAQAVRLTSSYLARFTKGRLQTLDVGSLSGAAVRNGATPAEVYRRPFVNVWTALGKGVPWAQAVEAGKARTSSSAEMDVALSTRAASVAYAASDGRIRGFLRVPDGPACEFCQLVSGQTYTTADLMPLHNRCGCTVEPITDGPAVTSSSGSTGSVAVEEHGELGPVLVNAGDTFTGPNDL